MDGYSIQSSETLPSDLTGYDVIIAANGSSIQGHMQEIEAYVQDGGGYVYMLSAAAYSDLGTNHYWLGAQSYGLTGYGESASVSVENPLGADLQEADLLKQQDALESGAIWVNELEPGAVALAEYSGGNVFAYAFEYEAGRVYFQADTDHGIAVDAEARIKELLRAGMVWTSLGAPDLVSQSEPAAGDILPDGTQITTGNEPPNENYVVVFDGVAPQSSAFPNPSNMTSAIFVTVTAQVLDASLLFKGDGQQYTYHVQPDSNALLRFPSEISVTNVTITTAEQGNSSEASGTVGYVTFKDPPSCSLPPGAASSAAGSIPDNSMQVGSAGTDTGTVLDVPDPLVPVSSIFAGFDQEDVTGFVVGFSAGGLDYACPILPATMDILFDQPIVISDVRFENVGPWGEVGYESFDDATAYLRYNNSKAANLPGGLQPIVNATAPQEVYNADFAAGAFGTIPLTSPVGGNVQAIWMSAGQDLVEPYLYFSSGESWYSTAIDRSSNGTLLSFADDLDIDGIYVAIDEAVQDDRVSIGYVYPIMLEAHAGSDLTVKERQTVHLDGSASTGPPGFSFSWTQVEGNTVTTVTLQNANTASAYFSAPGVRDSGAILVFKLAVVDDEGNRSEDTVSVRVTNEESSNHPPSISTIEDSAVNEGDQVVLIVSAYDSDGDTMTFSWTQNTEPPVALFGANTAALSFIAPEVDSNTTLSFLLRVTDDEGRSTSDTVLVFVRDLPEEVAGMAPVLSAGKDQVVSEGSLVVLNGSLVGPTDGSYSFHWTQVEGTMVDLSNPMELNASFIAPEVGEGPGMILVFQLDLLDAGVVLQSDEVSVIVNNAAAPVELPVSGEEEELPEQGPTPLAVVESAFDNTVVRLDPEPPDDIFTISFEGSGNNSTAFAPNPSGEIIGIWLNTTADVSELELSFASSTGQRYSIDEIPINHTVAYVFDRDVALHDIRVNGTAGSDQVLQMGYYYGQFPVAPSIEETQESEIVSSDDVLFPRPAEGPFIAWVRENTMLAGAMVIGIPTGIAITLKKVSDHRRRMSSSVANPAKLLFPKSDPIAGEAEKVRPVIEELEEMLGRNLDTALNASELLDRFGSGSSKSDRAKQ